MPRKLSILLLATSLLASSCLKRWSFLHFSASATKIAGLAGEYEVTCNALGMLHEPFEESSGSKDVMMALTTGEHVILASAPRKIDVGTYVFKIRTSLRDRCEMNVAVVLEDGRLLGPVPLELVLPP